MINPSYLPDSNKIAQQAGPLWNLDQSPWIIWNLPENEEKWKWCAENCKGEYDLSFPDATGIMYWMFELDTDAVAFSLRWF